MLHRLATGFGWLTARVSGGGERWEAILTEPHPSLARVAPGVGRTPVEALADLALALSRLCTSRRARPRACAPDAERGAAGVPVAGTTPTRSR